MQVPVALASETRSSPNSRMEQTAIAARADDTPRIRARSGCTGVSGHMDAASAKRDRRDMPTWSRAVGVSRRWGGGRASVRPSGAGRLRRSYVRCGEIRSDAPRTAAKQLNSASAEITFASARAGRRTPSMWGPRCLSGIGSNPIRRPFARCRRFARRGSRPRGAPANRRSVRARRSPSGGVRTLCADRHRSVVRLADTRRGTPRGARSHWIPPRRIQFSSSGSPLRCSSATYG